MATKKTAAEKDLAKQLRNIGPAMAKKMLAAGIDSPEKLHKLGAKEAYKLMYATGDSYGDHNAAYLHALEGAIRDCDWADVPDSIRQEHQKFARELQSEKQAENYNQRNKG